MRDTLAELLRRLPVNSTFVGPPKDEDDQFSDFLNRGSRWTKKATFELVFPPAPVTLPAAMGVFGPTKTGFLAPNTYEGVPGLVYNCPDARIFNQPHAIISPDDRLFVFASTWHSPRPRSHFAFHRIHLGRVRRLPGTSLYFGGNSNVWHFYVDSLRQICLLEKAGRTLRSFDHIIAKKPTTPVEHRFYQALGIDEARLVDRDAHLHLQCEHLTFFDGGSPRHGLWEIPLLRNLVFRATGIAEQPNARRRLYVSRGQAATRRVINEKELAEWLQTRGFEILRLETMTPDDQIASFRDASIVVGAHGAGLTHILFAQPGAVLIELRNLAFAPENGVAECYRTTSGLKGIHYIAVTTLDALTPSDPHNSDLRFSLRDLQDAVALAEARCALA